MRRRLRIALAFASVVWATTCGGEDDEAQFATDQLSDLVAQRDDAPPGTRYDDAQSGAAPIEVLSQGVVSAQSRFAELGFLGGRTSIFVSSDELPPPAGSIIGSGVFVFENGSAASDA